MQKAKGGVKLPRSAVSRKPSLAPRDPAVALALALAILALAILAPGFGLALGLRIPLSVDERPLQRPGFLALCPSLEKEPGKEPGEARGSRQEPGRRQEPG